MKWLFSLLWKKLLEIRRRYFIYTSHLMLKYLTLKNSGKCGSVCKIPDRIKQQKYLFCSFIYSIDRNSCWIPAVASVLFLILAKTSSIISSCFYYTCQLWFPCSFPHTRVTSWSSHTELWEPHADVEMFLWRRLLLSEEVWWGGWWWWAALPLRCDSQRPDKQRGNSWEAKMAEQLLI